MRKRIIDIETKASRRERKRRKKMVVQGKSVFQLRQLARRPRRVSRE